MPGGKTRKRKATSTKRAAASKSSFVCPECGFKAAHAMGLGRHRSARHGVASKRQLMARGRISLRGDARLVQRLSQLERRYERLLRGLTRVLTDARR